MWQKAFYFGLLLLFAGAANAGILSGDEPNPADSRLSLWLKADDGVVADGAGLVYEWTNMSANTFNAVAPPGSEPLKTTDIIGGSTHDVVYFDDSYPQLIIPDAGTDDKLDPQTSDFTIICVAKAAHGDVVLYSVKEDDASSYGNGYRIYQCCNSDIEGDTSDFRVRFCSLPAGSTSDDYNGGTQLNKPQSVFWSYRVLTAQMDVTGSTATIKGWLNGDATGWVPGAAGADNDVIEIFGEGGVDANGPWRMESSSIATREMWVAELLIYKGSLTDAERQDIENYLLGKYNRCFTAAANPSPADGAIDVDPNVTLSWRPGSGALSHDVYFGADFNDVNSAFRLAGDVDGDGQVNFIDIGVLTNQWLEDPIGGPQPYADLNSDGCVDLVDFATIARLWRQRAGLAFKGNQTATSYDPPTLAEDQTYYWRIDEVYPGETVKGNIWQFTTATSFSLPTIFSDHMVLQADKPITVWGFASPSQNVTVEFRGATRETVAGQDGKWTVTLPASAKGGPFEMVVSNSDTEIDIHDVLVGEVWLASGQSNMEWSVENSDNAATEISDAINFPQIRLFHVPRKVADTPQDDVQAQWEICSPETIPTFSAVQYFFGRGIHQTRQTPVGLIEAAYGGTSIEAWMRMAVLEALPEGQATLARIEDNIANYDRYYEDWEVLYAEAQAAGEPLPTKPEAPILPGNSKTPEGLFNGMIHPVLPYTVRGFLWYQGEKNARFYAFDYRNLFIGLIEDWRQLWGSDSTPFLFVQLPNYDMFHPEQHDWPTMRESQVLALQLAETGMAITIDIGNPNDIHPTNKQEFGHRLSLLARHRVYGENISDSGPLYGAYHKDGNSIFVDFDYVYDGLSSSTGQALEGFDIAGSDGQYQPANAQIDGNSVRVWADAVADPQNVRYAWYNQPQISLFNSSNLPAAPFRTTIPQTASPTVYFNDGFESGNFTIGGWTKQDTNASVIATAKYTGAYGARCTGTTWIEKAQSTVGYGSVHVRYVRKTYGMDSGENLYVEWSINGINWYNLETTAGTSWVSQDKICPSWANDKSGFRIRFRTNANSTTEYAYIDDVQITGYP